MNSVHLKSHESLNQFVKKLYQQKFTIKQKYQQFYETVQNLQCWQQHINSLYVIQNSLEKYNNLEQSESIVLLVKCYSSNYNNTVVRYQNFYLNMFLITNSQMMINTSLHQTEIMKSFSNLIQRWSQYFCFHCDLLNHLNNICSSHSKCVTESISVVNCVQQIYQVNISDKEENLMNYEKEKSENYFILTEEFI